MRALVRLQFASILEPLNRRSWIALGFTVERKWAILRDRRIHGMLDDMWIFTWWKEKNWKIKKGKENSKILCSFFDNIEDFYILS